MGWEIKAVLGLIMFTLIVGGVKLHDFNIRQQAVQDFNRKQLELVLKNQEDQAAKLKEVQKLQTQYLADLKQNSDQLDTKFGDIQQRLSTIKGGENQSSKLLKETVRELLNSMQKGAVK
jgi:hypothetical protein